MPKRIQCTQNVLADGVSKPFELTFSLQIVTKPCGKDEMCRKYPSLSQNSVFLIVIYTLVNIVCWIMRAKLLCTYACLKSCYNYHNSTCIIIKLHLLRRMHGVVGVSTKFSFINVLALYLPYVQRLLTMTNNGSFTTYTCSSIQ